MFSSGAGILLDDIVDITGIKQDKVVAYIDELTAEYKERHSSIIILPEGRMYKMMVSEKYLEVVHRINPHTELTRQVLETLAVVAFKQPMLQSEVIHERTSAAYEHISELVEKGFVVREKHGRSYLLKLTQKFYDYFDLPAGASVKEIFKGIQDMGENQSHVADFDKEPRLGQLEVYNLDIPEERQSSLEVYHAHFHKHKAKVEHHPIHSVPVQQKKTEQPKPQTTIIHDETPEAPAEEAKKESAVEDLKQFEVPAREPFQVQPKQPSNNQGSVNMTFSGPISMQNPPQGEQPSQQAQSSDGGEQPSQSSHAGMKTTQDIIGESEVADTLEEGESVVEHEAVNKRVQEILSDDEDAVSTADDNYEFSGDPDRIHLGPYPVSQARYELEGVSMNKREKRLMEELSGEKDLSFMRTDDQDDVDDEGGEEVMDEESEIEAKAKQIESGHAKFEQDPLSLNVGDADDEEEKED